MKSICFFSSYFTSNNLPYYITVYLKELKKHFTEVVLLTSQNELSESSLQFLKTENIQFIIEKNEGFDFGLWYKAFQKYDVDVYDQIALVNDSCILFKPLDEFMNWSMYNNADLHGMTQSDSIAPHIQSYFLVLNKNAIKFTKEYFSQKKILKHISDVINTYEVGLSTYLISKGLKIASFIDNNNYTGEFSPYYYCVDYHIYKGIPLIKKKILFSSYRKEELFTLARMNFNIDVKGYIQLIHEQKHSLIISFDKLLTLENNKMNGFQVMKYNITRSLIQLLRKIK